MCVPGRIDISTLIISFPRDRVTRGKKRFLTLHHRRVIISPATVCLKSTVALLQKRLLKFPLQRAHSESDKFRFAVSVRARATECSLGSNFGMDTKFSGLLYLFLRHRDRERAPFGGTRVSLADKESYF